MDIINIEIKVRKVEQIMEKIKVDVIIPTYKKNVAGIGRKAAACIWK